MPGSHTPNTVIFPTCPLPQNYFAENRSDILLIVAVLFFIIETAAFGLRVAARRLTSRPYGWDDTFTVLALVTNLAICTWLLA
ncbi:hypothetical protein HYALB_00011200 [Hymenoscyphus albidus]|uniref:Uncharacterized protein n=1 Tax=Hymenoscyphus albidus TaxID=595503 RepID=A0A9N9LNU1_9HELO|nr:hypothetical protein HYALB_00011200 [Hymenoscyphus albidus]